MNVPFVLGGIRARPTPSHRCRRNMVGFRTNTPWGFGAWLRASFYTATSVEQAERLAAFMVSFASAWRHQANAPAASSPPRGSPEI